MNKKTNMGWSLLFVAGLFLWNPVIGVRDFLPDVIGYLLLCVGISRLADLNDDLADAQKSFRAMLWVGFGEMVAWLLVNVLLKHTGDTLNRYEQPVWTLLFAFSFLVLEWYFMLPGWNRFFKGLASLAQFNGGTAVLSERGEKTLCERMSAFSRAFVIVRTLCSLLPEMTVLTSFEHDAENPAFTVDWFSHVSVFRVLAVLVVLTVGGVWLFRYLRFILIAERDAEWQERLQERYETEILPDSGLLLKRRVGAAFTFFRVAVVFGIDLTLMYHQILPDWGIVLLVLCGCLMLGKLLPVSWEGIACGGSLLAVGVLRSVLNTLYLKKYTPPDADHLPAAYAKYLPVRILGIVEAGLTALFLMLLLWRLLNMAKERLPDLSKSENAFSERETAKRLKELRGKSLPVFLLLALSAVAKIAEVLLQQTYGWIWMIQVACSFAVVVCFFGVLSLLAELLSERYPAGKRE